MDAAQNAGEPELKLKIIRQGERQTVTVKSAERPAAYQLWFHSARNRAHHARNDPDRPNPANEEQSHSAQARRPESTDNRAPDEDAGHTESELEKRRRELTAENWQLREAINDLKK